MPRPSPSPSPARARLTLRLGLLLSAFLAVVSPSATDAETQRTIGLALGGGSARGLAHIGFLEWLDEHRIPVHRIAGTSMGGLVGGAYASGMSPKELRRLMREMDWDLVFLSDSPFKYKTFRRKEDARLYPSQIELGLKGGLRFPAGMNSAQEIAFVLDRIAAPYYGVGDFDDLPIPFRSVAADLRSQSQVVLDSGSLAVAMRATMAIPGVFTPVAVGDRLLVDGGTLNNVPADIARGMGADIVIAVNVGAATDGLPAPTNLFEVLGQTMDVMMAAGVDRALASADIVVTPDLKGLTGTDFRQSDVIADRGYAAAEAMKDALLPYAVSEESYAGWRRDLESRIRRLPETITHVRVEGLDVGQAEPLESRLNSIFVGQPFDPEAITRQAHLLMGTDLYSVVRYRLEESDAYGGTGLVFSVEPKDYGPPFLMPNVDLQNIDSDNFALNVRARLLFFDTLVPSSEIRIDGVVGTRLEASSELFWRVGGSRIFLAPRAYARRKNLNVFDQDDRFLALYREKSAGFGADVGLDLGPLSELRLGYDVADLRARLHVGEPTLPEADGHNRFFSLRFAVDGQTSPVIPTRGVYLRLRGTHYLETPRLVTGDGPIDGPADYNQAETRLSYFHSLPGQHRLFFGASGGTSFGDDPGYNLFSLGGLLRLGAFNADQVRTENYFLLQGGTLIRVLRLPDFLGGNGYLGGWLEVGSAFDRWEDRRTEWQASTGFILETILGPAFIGGSFSLQRSDGRFYISLAPFLR